jgi:hypothetical protein
LDSKQVLEQLQDNLDSFTEFNRDSDIDIFCGIDSKICGPDLSDCCSNSENSHASADVDADNGADDDGAYDDEDSDNDDWALWEENYHDYYTISFCASSGYTPPQNGQIPVFTHEYVWYFISAFLNKYLLQLTDV